MKVLDYGHEAETLRARVKALEAALRKCVEYYGRFEVGEEAETILEEAKAALAEEKP